METVKNQIRKKVNALELDTTISHLLAELVYAELFNAIRIYELEIDISLTGSGQIDDTRVWAEVIVKVQRDELATFNFAAFTQQGATLSKQGSYLVFRKTYFIHE